MLYVVEIIFIVIYDVITTLLIGFALYGFGLAAKELFLTDRYLALIWLFFLCICTAALPTAAAF